MRLIACLAIFIVASTGVARPCCCFDKPPAKEKAVTDSCCDDSDQEESPSNTKDCGKSCCTLLALNASFHLPVEEMVQVRVFTNPRPPLPVPPRPVKYPPKLG